jgi:hypothetical protein
MEECPTKVYIFKVVFCWTKIYWLTDSSNWRPSWVANNRSASQEFARFYRNRRFITVPTCPDPERHESSPNTPTLFLNIHFNIILHLRIGRPNGLFPSGFRTKTCPFFSSSSYMLHAPPIFILLIFDEEYKLWRCTLCSLHQPPLFKFKWTPHHLVLKV